MIAGKNISGLFLIFAANSAIAYELNTHAQITGAAFARTQLFKDASLSRSLGIEAANNYSFGNVFYETVASTPKQRLANRFEGKAMPTNINQASLQGWLMRGAIREDDLTQLGCLFDAVLARIHGRQTGDCNPPESEINRVLNHFYDPIYKRGLVLGVNGEKAPNWATGSIDAFGSPNTPSATTNRFTLMDARRAMYYALSGKQPDGTPADESARKAWWATTFYSLGSALHLVQDMAQPQHTRNEGHTGSLYEGYINARALGLQQYQIGTSTATLLAPLNYGPSTAVVRFDKYSDFFSNANAGGAQIGLADFSNKYFLTEGTNLNILAGALYPMPSRNRSAYGTVEKTGAEFYSSGSTLRLLTSPSAETNIPSSGGRQMYISTESIWTDFSGQGPQYSMTRFNYDDQAELLLPKAAAYSAGMIDYFFRGKIDCVPDATQLNACRIQNLGREAMSGTFEFFYDDVNGLRRPVPNSKLTGIELAPSVNATDGLLTIFDQPTDPAPKKLGTYILVFSGTMGSEGPSGENIGAVTGKVVSLRNSNALYLVGLDSVSQRIYMRVDRSGTKVLSTSEFHPLRPLSINFLSGRSKSYLTKQVEFFNGGAAYRTRAITVGGTQGINDTSIPRLTGYVFNDDNFDPKPGTDYSSCSQLCWQAEATQVSGQYRYKFSLNVSSSNINIFDGKIAGLSFERSNLVNSISFALDSGSVALPPLPTGLTGLSYAGAAKGELLISPDGRTIVGFKGMTADRQTKHYKLQLTIGDSVTAQWVPTITDSYVLKPSTPPTVTPAGVFTKTAPQPCDPLNPTVKASLPLSRIYEMSESFASQSTTVFFDYQRGNLLSFRNETAQKQIGQADFVTRLGTYVLGNCGIEWNLDKISGYSLHYTETSNSSYLLIEQAVSEKATLTGRRGGFSPPPPIYGNWVADNFIVDYEYLGPLSGWSVPWEAYGPPRVPISGTSVLRPLTSKLNDAILVETQDDVDSITVHGQLVGSVAVTPLSSIISDASPLGELFFATRDLRIVIHDPLPDGIKPFVKPANVIYLLGAVWM